MSSKVKQIGTSRSIRAGITFPVGRIHSILKKGHYAQRVSFSAPVHLAAALQYLSLEILELAVEAARASKKNRVVPRHILFAVRRDDELSKMLDGVVISEAGVLPSIQPQLLPKKAPKSTE